MMMMMRNYHTYIYAYIRLWHIISRLLLEKVHSSSIMQKLEFNKCTEREEESKDEQPI